MDTNPDYRLLSPTDVERAADVISQAFMEDPLCTFMLPNRKSRYRTLLKFFRLYGELNIKNRCGYGAGEPLQGVAFWQSPDQDDLSISLKSLGKLLPLVFSGYTAGYLRARQVVKQTEALHQKYAAGPHYYLDNIGVLASARGQGFASRLIRPILAQADEQGVIAYTDTVTRSNVALYQHFGFECVEEAPVENTGITVWALRRPANFAF